MTSQDLATLAAVGVLVAALVATLAGFGVVVPLYVPGAAVLGVGAVIVGLRVYVAMRGADKTTVDERLDAIEQIVVDLRKAVGR